MTGPIDTIREALGPRPKGDHVLAALTEVEQQLAEVLDQCKTQAARLLAAEQRANELGNQLAQERSKPGGSFDQWAMLQAVDAALRWYDDHKADDGSYDGAIWGDLSARAALDRQEQP